MVKQYHDLHTKMSHSTDTKDMILFGDVMKHLFETMVTVKPDAAKQALDILEAINWNQYVSRAEATKIVSGMKPSAKWDYPTLMATLTKLEMPTEEAPYYNSCALWVVISQLYSDIGDILAWSMGKEPATVEEVPFLKYLYKMALSYLKDQDGMYNIRRYFEPVLK